MSTDPYPRDVEPDVHPTDCSTCRSCQAPVIWTEDVHTRRRGPLDRDPVMIGNVVLVGRHPRGILSEVLGDEQQAHPRYRDHARYVSHFVTCPQAGQWRRK